jgi:hypothetical protein
METYPNEAQRRQEISKASRVFSKIIQKVNLYFVFASLFLSLMIEFTNLNSLTEKIVIGTILLLIGICNGFLGWFYLLYQKNDFDEEPQDAAKLVMGVLFGALVGAVTFFKIQPFNSLTLTLLTSIAVFSVTTFVQCGALLFCFEDISGENFLDLRSYSVDNPSWLNDRINIFVSGTLISFIIFTIAPFVLFIELVL